MTPIYCYRREDGTVEEHMYPMGEGPKQVTCEDGEVAVRSLRDERRGHSKPMGPHWPHVSASMGVLPSQIKEAQREFPEHKFTPDGDMIFDNPGHLDQCMKDLKVDQHSDPQAVTKLTVRP